MAEAPPVFCGLIISMIDYEIVIARKIKKVGKVHSTTISTMNHPLCANVLGAIVDSLAYRSHHPSAWI